MKADTIVELENLQLNFRVLLGTEEQRLNPWDILTEGHSKPRYDNNELYHQNCNTTFFNCDGISLITRKVGVLKKHTKQYLYVPIHI